MMKFALTGILVALGAGAALGNTVIGILTGAFVGALAGALFWKLHRGS